MVTEQHHHKTANDSLNVRNSQLKSKSWESMQKFSPAEYLKVRLERFLGGGGFGALHTENSPVSSQVKLQNLDTRQCT